MAIDASAVGKELPETTFEYTERDVMLYALGVGATTDELNFVYEKNLQTLPTFGVVPAFPALGGIGKYIKFNPMMLLHGEQIVEWFRAFETVEDRVKVVTLNEIKEEAWTLNISRYVLPPLGEDILPFPVAVAAFKEALTDVRAAEDHLRAVLTHGGWLE